VNEDARFEDAGEAPLRLKALDAEDLSVLSALVQVAIFPGSEMPWFPQERRFALLLNRFRWEDIDAATKRGRPVERVQSVLAVEDVMKVRSQGIDRREADTILSILSVAFTPGEDGAGTVELTLAGDGAIALDVEALEIVLKDVTRPYIAPSRKSPDHGE